MLVTLTLHARANRGLASWSNEPPREMSTTSRQHVDPPSPAPLPSHSRPSAEAKGSHSGEISPRQPPSLSLFRLRVYNLPYSYFVPLLRSSISEYLNSRVAFSKCQRTNERERERKMERERDARVARRYLAFFARVINAYVYIRV